MHLPNICAATHTDTLPRCFMSHPSLSITYFLVYEAKQHLSGTVMDLLCCGHADWIDGLNVYSLAAHASADGTDLPPVDRH